MWRKQHHNYKNWRKTSLQNCLTKTVVWSYFRWILVSILLLESWKSQISQNFSPLVMTLSNSGNYDCSMRVVVTKQSDGRVRFNSPCTCCLPSSWNLHCRHISLITHEGHFHHTTVHGCFITRCPSDAKVQKRREEKTTFTGYMKYTRFSSWLRRLAPSQSAQIRSVALRFQHERGNK